MFKGTAGMKKIGLVLCAFISVSALAFSGGGGGRTPPGRIATTYKGGANVIGIHFGGDKEPCPEHSTEIQGLCYCDEGYTHDGNGACVADMCLEYEPTDCLPDCDPLTGDPVAGNEGKYCNNKTGRCSLGACLAINCNSCEDLVDGECVERTCQYPNEVCRPATNKCGCIEKYARDPAGFCVDFCKNYHDENGCNPTCDWETGYGIPGNEGEYCANNTGRCVQGECVAISCAAYSGAGIADSETYNGDLAGLANDDITECRCQTNYEWSNNACREPCADGYLRNQETSECELICSTNSDCSDLGTCMGCVIPDGADSGTCQYACEEVEYLESTGTQWIDTGFASKNTTKVECTAIWTYLCSEGAQMDCGNRTLYGVRSNLSTMYEILLGQQFHLYYQFANHEPVITFNFGQKTKYLTDNNKLYIDDVLKITNPISDFENIYNMAIFALNKAGEISRFSNAKMYYFKIWDNDKLVRDFIPVLDPDGTPAMLDRVENKLYYNQGTGQFKTNKDENQVLVCGKHLKQHNIKKSLKKVIDRREFFLYNVATVSFLDGAKGYSSAGRASVSKTEGRGFDAYCPCQNRRKEKMKTTPAQFVRQVKQEVSKITWPSRAETMQGTFVVITMSVVLAAFLLCVDGMIAWVMQWVIGG